VILVARHGDTHLGDVATVSARAGSQAPSRRPNWSGRTASSRRSDDDGRRRAIWLDGHARQSALEAPEGVGGIAAKTSTREGRHSNSVRLGFVVLLSSICSARVPLDRLATAGVVMNSISLAGYGLIRDHLQKGHGSEATGASRRPNRSIPWISIVIFAFLYGLSMDYEVSC